MCEGDCESHSANGKSLHDLLSEDIKEGRRVSRTSPPTFIQVPNGTPVKLHSHTNTVIIFCNEFFFAVCSFVGWPCGVDRGSWMHEDEDASVDVVSGCNLGQFCR